MRDKDFRHVTCFNQCKHFSTIGDDGQIEDILGILRGYVNHIIYVFFLSNIIEHFPFGHSSRSKSFDPDT